MKELRCKKCKKLIAKTDAKGVVEIKCKCGYYNKIELH